MTSNNVEKTSSKKTPPVPLSELPRTIFSRHWWWTTLIVFVGIVLLARLGIWQLDRLQQRKTRNAAYLQQIANEPFELNGQHFPDDPVVLRDRSALVIGEYDFTEQIILTQQNWQRRPGAHLITPLRISGSEFAVLVNRGWIPSAEAEAEALSQYDQQGIQKVSGAIQLSQTLSGDRETVIESPKKSWYRIDVAAIQQQIPYKLLPIFLLESPSENETVQLPYRMEPDIDLSDGPHLAYAIQWFLFAAVLTIGYLRYVSTYTFR
jgi:surfeit locus 1 family protein